MSVLHTPGSYERFILAATSTSSEGPLWALALKNVAMGQGGFPAERPYQTSFRPLPPLCCLGVDLKLGILVVLHYAAM